MGSRGYGGEGRMSQTNSPVHPRGRVWSIHSPAGDLVTKGMTPGKKMVPASGCSREQLFRKGTEAWTR